MAQQQGYHVLIYLSHESFSREAQIMQQFKNGRVDGLLMSVSGETFNTSHLAVLEEENIPLVMFDSTMPGVKAARVVTDDFESCYRATQHLLLQCNNLVYLSVSNLLDINNKRKQGFLKACNEKEGTRATIIDCSLNNSENILILQQVISTQLPDGIVAPIEKLVIPIYTVCHQLHIAIPGQLKVVAYSNLSTAAILDPPLSTITQPAYSMGQQAATILFKALKKTNFRWQSEQVIVPSVLHVRGSSVLVLI